MGNYRFKLSDMIPNAWFYKLKDMNKSRNQNPSSHHQNPKKKKPSNTTTLSTTQPNFSNPRHSYYFTTDPFKAEKLYNSPINPKISDTHFPEPPRKSSKRSRTTTKRKTKSSSSPPLKLVNGCSSRATTLDSVWNSNSDNSPFDTSPESNFYEFLLPESGSERVSATDDAFDSTLTSWSSTCSCRISSSTADIIIDVDTSKERFTTTKYDKFDGFESIPNLELPPILTKPAKKFNDMVSDIKKKEKFKSSTKLEQRRTHNGGSLSMKVVKEQKSSTSSTRKSSVGTSGMKLRSNSPKIASKKIKAYNRKSISSTMTTTTTSSKTSNKKNIADSFAIVKSSFDPQRDFRESMVEMIVENNIRASKDLEELLACYLSLNSNEYHNIIVKVFEQIWFDLTSLRL